MKKIFISLFLIAITTVCFGMTYLRTAGPHTLYAGDTLKKSTTLTYSSVFIPSNFQYVHVYLRTTNPADSVSYQVYYRVALSPSDSFVVPGDSVGNEISSTIITVTDTLRHYYVMKLPDANLSYLQILTASDAGQGNRARIWLKLYFSQ
jgi:hypothetical protein